MRNKKDITNAALQLARLQKRRKSNLKPNEGSMIRGNTLRLIQGHDGISVKELAKMLDIRPSSLTQKLDKLQEDGEIRREKDANDARITKIYITEKGTMVLDARVKQKQQRRREFFDCLSEEEAAIFCELCNRMSDNLKDIIEEEQKEKEKEKCKEKEEQ